MMERVSWQLRPFVLNTDIYFHVGIIQMDGYLEPFRDALKSRFSKAQQWVKTIDETEGGLEKFSKVSRQFDSQNLEYH